jgi:hypothetical protein
MVYDLFRALPGEPGFLATIAGAMREHRRRLDTSVGVSGPHGFIVRGKCTRLVGCHVHRIPHPTFVTIAKRPSGGCRTREVLKMICPTG